MSEKEEKSAEDSPEHLEDAEKSEDLSEENSEAENISTTEDVQWEDSLNEKLTEKELKKLEKKKLKDKIKEKQRELNKKTSEIIEGQFLKVFDKRVRLYTIVFIIGAILIGVFVTIPFDEGETGINFLGKQGITNFNQFLIITISFIMIIGFGIIFLLSRVKKFHDLLFSEKIFLQLHR